MQTEQRTIGGLQAVLQAPRRASEIPDTDDVYGWLVGSWELEIVYYRAADVGSLRGEAHFGWVLEGRAIQDVWIMPRVADRTRELGRIHNMYGTTLRIWDPELRAWHIRWFNPVTGHEERQIGRRVSGDIVQVGARQDGTPTRWRYTEITPNSFHWVGEALAPDGETWKLEAEFRARRLG